MKFDLVPLCGSRDVSSLSASCLPVVVVIISVYLGVIIFYSLPEFILVLQSGNE